MTKKMYFKYEGRKLYASGVIFRINKSTVRKFGGVIEEMKVDNDIRYRELAEWAGVADSTVKNVLYNKHGVSVDVLTSILDVFGYELLIAKKGFCTEEEHS